MDYEFIPDSFFEKYVKNGRLVKEEYFVSNSRKDKIRVVLYATKCEQWRIKAYTLLKQTAEKSGWNEGFERMEGSLLGYEDWQNDIYIKEFYSKK